MNADDDELRDEFERLSAFLWRYSLVWRRV